MKLIHVCQQFAGLLNAAIFACFIFLFFILVSPVVIGVALFRFIVSKCVIHLNKGLSKVLTSGAHIFAVDDVTGNPNVNVIIMLTFKGPISVDEVRELFRERILDLKNEKGEYFYPELQQYYHHWLGFIFWKWDKNFDVMDHIRLYDYDDMNWTNGADKDDLMRVRPTLIKKGWKKEKSPWEFLLVPNFSDDEPMGNFLGDQVVSECKKESSEGGSGTAMIFRFHHGIGDGFGFFNLLWKNLAAAPPEEVKFPSSKFSKDPERGLCYFLFSPVTGHFEYAQQLINSNDDNPWKVPERDLAVTGSSAMTKKIPVEFIKEIRRQFQISFTAALLGLITGALRQSMMYCKIDVPDTIHALLPIPSRFRNKGKLRNYITYIYPELPVGVSDFRARFLLCESSIHALRNSTVPLMNKLAHETSGSMTVPIIKAFHKNVLATALISIFPGPTRRSEYNGIPITDVTFGTSCHGSNGICISVLTYDSNLRVSVDVNDAVPCGGSNLANLIVANIENELNRFWNFEESDMIV